jgi:hypothetical protein
MALVERLAILITGDATGAVSALKDVASQAEKSAAKADGSASKFSGTATKVGAGLMAAGAGLLAFAISGISTAEQLGTEVRKLQRYTGMTAEEASKLAAVAKHVNVPVDTLAAGLGKLSKAMEAGSPGFDSLGVSARDSDGKLKSLGAFLPELADKFKDLPNGPEKTATALQLFGRNGMEMMPFLNKGAAGMKELGDEAEKMGLVLSQDNVDQILKSKEAHKKLDETLQGLKTQIGLQVMPVITSFTEILGSIPGPIQDILVPLVTFGGVALVGFGAVGMLVGALSNLGPMFTAVKVAVAELEVGLGPIGWTLLAVTAAVAVATAAFGLFSDQSTVNKDDTETFTQALQGEAGALDDSTSRAISARVAKDKLSEAFINSGASADSFSKAVQQGDKTLADAARNMKDLGSNGYFTSGAYNKLSGDQKEFVDSLTRAADEGKITNEELANLLSTAGSLASSYGEASSSSTNLADANTVLAPVVTDLAGAQAAAASATADHVQAAKDLDEQLHKTFDPVEKSIAATRSQARAQQDQEKAVRDVAAAQAALTAAQTEGDPKKVAEATDALTQAQRHLEDSNSTLLQATADQEVAFTNLRGELEQHPEKLKAGIEKIDAWAASGKITAAQAEEMKRQIYAAAVEAQGFPKTIDTAIQVRRQELDDAFRTYAEFYSYIEKHPLGSPGKGLGFVLPQTQNASGGSLPAGRMSLVGEHGPELFVPSSAGSVINALSTEHAMSGGGGGVVVQNLNVTLPNVTNGDQLVDELQRYIRRNGPLPLAVA